MEPIEFPDYINTMPSFFCYELDEFCVVVMALMVGYVLRGLWPFAGIAVGMFLASKMKKWKRGELDGAIPQIMFQKGWLAVNKLYKNARDGSLWV
ncbi:type IV conjugative transfer system protein TraL [Allopusillimonas ginsengisoli]|uniref:type IV conjugative transfer system protein TraL n=1 Tax=Allopusillimonas ginsengisoli TaxID=453575 RepID=UPI0039C19FF1